MATATVTVATAAAIATNLMALVAATARRHLVVVAVFERVHAESSPGQQMFQKPCCN